MSQLRRQDTYRLELPVVGGMRVPGVIFTAEDLKGDQAALDQVRNVAHLQGIVTASMAMPDIHTGYGFPIGGVAATDVHQGGVVSPGGVGFDICCGVRLLATPLDEADFVAHRSALMAELDRRIPRGLGKGAIADQQLLEEVLHSGAGAAVAAGYGTAGDLDRCEDRGCLPEATPDALSEQARHRGGGQLGSLGAGNHFLEVQVVEEVTDPGTAEAFGLTPGMVCVMIHTGSRGLGHQTCQDHLRLMAAAMARYRIELPDRQLACVPVDSPEGRAYLGAMAAAANFAWANRQILAEAARRALAAATTCSPASMPLIYDVAHNLAKIERHPVDGVERLLCVHRKGATRSLPPGHRDLPTDLSESGQPVLVPGSMGTASWVLRGLAANPAFASAAHGAGRVMSRHAALKVKEGRAVKSDLEKEGIAIRPGSVKLLAEEAPYAYKDVDLVAETCEGAGLAARVARLRPLGVVKG